MIVAMPTASQPAADLASAAERAYEHTKLAIIRGDLAPGTMISEGLICERLGISRTPVHEAFLRLDAEEFLTLASRKGAVVRPISPREALDVLEMREAVEASAAARVAADGRAPELAQALAPMLDAQQAALDAGDLEHFAELDSDFHTAVVAASRNEIAIHFARLLRDRQQRLRYQLVRSAPDQMAVELGQHRQLAAAMAAADAAAYRTVLAEHVSLHQGSL